MIDVVMSNWQLRIIQYDNLRVSIGVEMLKLQDQS